MVVGGVRGGATAWVGQDWDVTRKLVQDCGEASEKVKGICRRFKASWVCRSATWTYRMYRRRGRYHIISSTELISNEKLRLSKDQIPALYLKILILRPSSFH